MYEAVLNLLEDLRDLMETVERREESMNRDAIEPIMKNRKEEEYVLPLFRVFILVCSVVCIVS